jgi:hypothetical protein
LQSLAPNTSIRADLDPDFANEDPDDVILDPNSRPATTRIAPCNDGVRSKLQLDVVCGVRPAQMYEGLPIGRVRLQPGCGSVGWPKERHGPLPPLWIAIKGDEHLRPLPYDTDRVA